MKQGIHSTKQKKTEEVVQDNGSVKIVLLKKHRDIFIRINEVRETIYSN